MKNKNLIWNALGPNHSVDGIAPAFLSLSAAAAEANDFTPAQQARIGEIAADYLVA
ncbi:hypothetical protein [Cedecea sp. AS113]|uniref:hypothetical protein n=1 Tax=unclassified Cedecea TaxID=2649846 RepID=UPI003FA5C2D3